MIYTCIYNGSSHAGRQSFPNFFLLVWCFPYIWKYFANVWLVVVDFDKSVGSAVCLAGVVGSDKGERGKASSIFILFSKVALISVSISVEGCFLVWEFVHEAPSRSVVFSYCFHFCSFVNWLFVTFFWFSLWHEFLFFYQFYF